jgi:hypothetical protein
VQSLFDNPAGQIVSDRTGSHWEWAATPSDSTSTLLRKLDHPDLAIESSELEAKEFNPYDNSRPARRD